MGVAYKAALKGQGFRPIISVKFCDQTYSELVIDIYFGQ